MSKSKWGRWSGNPDRKLEYARGHKPMVEEYVERAGRTGQDLRYTVRQCPSCGIHKRPNAFTDSGNGRAGSVHNGSPDCRACQAKVARQEGTLDG